MHQRLDAPNLIPHRRNEEIEVLRAFAVLFVIVGHANNLLGRPEPLAFTNFFAFHGGVDLFFVVSGFVITSAFAREITEAGRENRRRYWHLVAAFWIRRAFRIIPSSWGWLFIMIFLSVVYNSTGIFGRVWANIGDFVSIALNIANFHFVKCVAAPDLWCGPNGIYWSISLEEQFYLLFPFLLLLPRRVLIVALAAAVLWMMVPQRTTLVWFTRFDGISLGVLLAFLAESYAYQVFRPTFMRSSPVRWTILAILLISIIMLPGAAGLVTFHPTMIVVVSAVLVFIASYDEGFLMPPGPFRRILVWIGERSFVLYLMHNVVFFFIRETEYRLLGGVRASEPTLIAAAVVLMIVLSEISFRFFETPLRRKGRVIAAGFEASGPDDPVAPPAENSELAAALRRSPSS